ncbi:GspH/FimT family pseudopilin [candidate division TA06 bacterium]|nr:GspH/FimT family pseudopilin [candidate division TA06 bacterium]
MNQEKKWGFSAIEVMVVMGILATLFAIGVPFYRNFRPRLILNQAAAQVRSDLMLSRQRAVTTSKSYLFEFDTGTQNYELFRVEGNDTLSLGERSLPARIEMVGDGSLPDILTFYPNGITNGQGRLFLIHTATNDTVRVIVTRAGFIRFEQR